VTIGDPVLRTGKPLSVDLAPGKLVKFTVACRCLRVWLMSKGDCAWWLLISTCIVLQRLSLVHFHVSMLINLQPERLILGLSSRNQQNQHPEK
jgi:hypothetical protein